MIKDELLEQNPELAADVFDAFAEAKRLYVERLKAGEIEKPTGVDEVHQRVMEITGDPLPYGIEPNRKVLERADRARARRSASSRSPSTRRRAVRAGDAHARRVAHAVTAEQKAEDHRAATIGSHQARQHVGRTVVNIQRTAKDPRSRS